MQSLKQRKLNLIWQLAGRKNSMKKVKQVIVIRVVIAVVIGAALVFAGVKLIKNKQAALEQSPKFKLNSRPVETVVAVSGTLREGHDYLALVEPIQTAEVSARVTAVISKVLHEEGDYVKAGDPLAMLEDKQISDSVAIVEAQISQAHAEDEANNATLISLKKTTAYWLNEKTRDSQLAAKQAIPESQAQASEEKYNAAKGKEQNTVKRSLVIKQQIVALERRIDELKTMKAYYTITSPFSGVVSAKLVDDGDLATPGKVLFTVEDKSSIKLTFDVPQVDLPHFKKGIAATFTFDNKKYDSIVSRVYPKINSARMIRAEAVLSKGEGATLPLGAYVTLSATFVTHSDNIIVPDSAIFSHKGKGEAVYTVKDGALYRTSVKVLGRARENAAVEGVNVGDVVVVNSFLGWAQLTDGMKVEAK